jgi:hypothetical protein
MFGNLSKSTENTCNFFLWLVLNVLLATAQLQNNMFSRIFAKGHQLKMAWYGDVCFKQQAVTEFLLEENDSVIKHSHTVKK